MQLSMMVDHPDLSKYVPLVKYLDTQEVISDESEDKFRCSNYYPQVYSRWCSERVAALMWQADAIVTETIFIPLGTHRKVGRLLCSRQHSMKFNNKAAAPVGLPRNCYNTNWLVSLPTCIVQQLWVVDKDYDFGTSDPDASVPPGPPSTSGPISLNPSTM